MIISHKCTKHGVFIHMRHWSKLFNEFKKLKEENEKHIKTNIHLVKKIEELNEYKAMYEDLCK